MATDKNLGFTLALAVLAAAGCGDDEGSEGGTNGSNGGSTNGSADGGGMGGGEVIDLTLVDVLATNADNPIAASHEVRLFDTATGEPIPGFEDPIFTEEGSGKFYVTGLPEDVVPTIYVVGNPNASPPTYDGVSVNQPYDSGETLLRISNVGLAQTAEQTGNFTPNLERASVGASIYWTPGGEGTPRMGTIGCAQVYIDDNNDPFKEDVDQRYNAMSGLPTDVPNQDRTNQSGRFYIGNIEPGSHTIRVTLDEGESFVAETEFTIPYSRQDALGGQDLVLYLLGVDVPGETNPTPDTCPGVY